ncbi:MAG: PrgI family protein [Candidatus Pacebacteria bacterium]|nr:PrgI family protein [Candidatus Paceibacterota bacterium]
MYEQDMIFGPFTFKQFIVLVIGCGLSYLLYKQIPQYQSLQIYIYITIAFIAAICLHVAFSIFKNKKIPVERLEDHLKTLHVKMSKENYVKMIFKQIAEVGSQIHMRKEKGLQEDESLNKAYGVLLAEYDIINLEHTKNNP